MVCFHDEFYFSAHVNRPNNIMKKVSWFAIDVILWDCLFKAAIWNHFISFCLFRYVIMSHLDKNLHLIIIIVGKVEFRCFRDSFVLQMDFQLHKTSNLLLYMIIIVYVFRTSSRKWWSKTGREGGKRKFKKYYERCSDIDKWFI